MTVAAALGHARRRRGRVPNRRCLALLLFAATGIAAACEPSADAPPREAYRGFQPTGYKGGPERDLSWFRAVRALRAGAGELQRYRFKDMSAANGGLAFDSIEPVFIGRREPAFAAFRQGCGQLFDSRGRPIDVGVFADWSGGLGPYTAGPQAMLKLYDDGRSFELGRYRFALFRDARLAARSPRSYLSSYGSTLQASCCPRTR